MGAAVKYNQTELRQELIIERAGVDWIAEKVGRTSSGQLDACHVIPKRVLKKVFPFGAFWDPALGFWQPLKRLEVVDEGVRTRTLDEILMDPDNVELGSRNLHNEWDDRRGAMIPRAQLRSETEDFATAHGLSWWLAEYYERRAA